MVVYVDLKLLYRTTVTKLLHHPQLSREEPFNSKTTSVVQRISGKADLVGHIAAYVSVEYFHKHGAATLAFLRRACAGSIIAMQRKSVTPCSSCVVVTL